MEQGNTRDDSGDVIVPKTELAHYIEEERARRARKSWVVALTDNKTMAGLLVATVLCLAGGSWTLISRIPTTAEKARIPSQERYDAVTAHVQAGAALDREVLRRLETLGSKVDAMAEQTARIERRLDAHMNGTPYRRQSRRSAPSRPTPPLASMAGASASLQ
jgi:hypothetical protein